MKKQVVIHINNVKECQRSKNNLIINNKSLIKIGYKNINEFLIAFDS